MRLSRPAPLCSIAVAAATAVSAGMLLVAGSAGAYVGAAPTATVTEPVATPTPTPSTSTGPRFASITFGRSTWLGADSCVPYPGSPTLENAVAWLASQGLPASTGVVVDYTRETTRRCHGDIIYPSWADLHRMRTSYGTTVVSQSKTYLQWDSATTAEQFRVESCDTLATFRAHGHTRAWGMFNYPSNVRSTVAEDVVSRCFAFGRRYDSRITKKSEALVAPYLVKARSVTSGMCNNPALACYTIPVKNNRRYMLPSAVIPVLNPASDQYGVVQFYRFVTGARLTGSTTRWDCTSPDVRDHWVNRPEVYCYNDFQTIVRGRGAGVTFTDAVAVAQAWGRVPAEAG